jgi:transcriptional regulator with XRE-family HTH domain
MRIAREALRMTQLELAERVGCSESQITKLETGRATADEWLRKQIAMELNIPSSEVGR